MTNPMNFGSRANVSALVGAMNDAQGNKDGLHGNEGQPKDSLAESGFADSQPALARVGAFLAPGLSTRDEVAALTRFVTEKEKAWGQPTTTLSAESIQEFGRFKAEKAAALTRFDRKPTDVTDAFVSARGSVDGQAIAPRQVFTQHWKPVGQPNGTTVVMSPGFLQTGRNFYEQIDTLNRKGYDVVVMDHQWAGWGSGKQGGIDRGYGIARDVAAVTAHAQGLMPNNRVVLLGTSMGAGAGVLGALTLNDAGKITLEGAQMPKGVSGVLQAPYFAKTPSLLNKALAFLGRVPLLKEIPLPAIGLPKLAEDKDINVKLGQHANAESLVARAQAFNASDADLGRVKAMLEAGHRPEGQVYVVHGEGDFLADTASARAFAGLLGDRAKFETLETRNHVMEEGKERGAMLEGLAWLGR
ncbi:MAG: alpha/beta hydrolase [Candidatus Sericytochromatia bacterium]